MKYGLKTQPLKWHGGKHYMADWIISLMPPHLHYVEPYFGGGAVLLARNPNRNWLIDNEWKLKNGEKVPAHLKGCSEVVNDINGELMNFWQVLSSEEYFGLLDRRLRGTPFSKEQYERSTEVACCNIVSEIFDQVERAYHFFVHARQSMAGRMNGFTPLTRTRTRGGINAEANAWLNVIEGLPEIHERLKGVVILNGDALKVIKQQDGEHTLFYCDPPYLHSTRTSTGEYGANEMTEEQHCELLMALNDIQGKFMLSGYHSDLYDAWCQQQQYTCHEREIDNKASSAKEKQKRTECVWTNY